MRTLLEFCGALFLLCVFGVFAFAAWLLASDRRAEQRYAAPTPEPNLPLTDEMCDAIWNDVQAAIAESRERTRRDTAARSWHALHLDGIDVVSQAEIESMIGAALEVCP